MTLAALIAAYTLAGATCLFLWGEFLWFGAYEYQVRLVAMTRESRRWLNEYHLTPAGLRRYLYCSDGVLSVADCRLHELLNQYVGARNRAYERVADLHPPARSLDLSARLHASLRHGSLHCPGGVRSTGLSGATSPCAE